MSKAMVKQFVRDLKDQERVYSVFMASEKMMLTDRNGKAYMSLNLSDSTGLINARVWDKVDDVSRGFEAGDFLLIKGHVQVYQNRRQIVVHELFRADASLVNLRDFVPHDRPDPEQLWQKLEAHVERIESLHIRQLLHNTLLDSEVRAGLRRAPAAKTIHHAYLGGLLEHIVAICDVLMPLADFYKFLNRDLLLFGAIYHDIGKIWELQIDEGIRYSDRGRLVGHMGIACELIDRISSQIADFPENTKDLLKHIVLSHHGKLEYGSPKVPSFPEAIVVSMIDDLDSKMNAIFMFMNSELQSGERWSRFHQQYDRYFYLDILRERMQALKAEPPKV